MPAGNGRQVKWHRNNLATEITAHCPATKTLSVQAQAKLVGKLFLLGLALVGFQRSGNRGMMHR